MACGGDLQLRAHDQRVRELAVAAHRVAGNGTRMGGDEVHQPEAEGLDAGVRSDVEGAVNGARGLDECMEREVGGAKSIEQVACALHVGRGLDLGQHEVAQAGGDGRHGGQVRFEGWMLHGMHAHCDAAAWRCGVGQLDHQRRVLGLPADRGTIFAIERDVEHAGTELLHQLGLQLQALAHPRFHAAVVVAHRNDSGARLGAEEDLTRMLHFKGTIRAGG
jgi:hypothetical protein